MIYAKQLRELVIQPALKGINLYSEDAEEFLMCICAQETQDGFYLKQTVGGDEAALGLFQMQPDTHDSIWNTTLVHNSGLAFDLLKLTHYPVRPKPEVMIYNLLYAAAMARIFWLHVKEPIPVTMDDRWALYKKYWNSYLGKATKDEFVANYNRYVKGEN